MTTIRGRYRISVRVANGLYNQARRDTLESATDKLAGMLQSFWYSPSIAVGTIEERSQDNKRYRVVHTEQEGGRG